MESEFCMNPCCAFFDSNLSNLNKVKDLLVEEDRLSWEALTASTYSPGVVLNEERLCRQMIRPAHYDEDKFSPTAFDDFMNKGLSTDRLNHTTVEGIVGQASERVRVYNELNPEKEQRNLGCLVEFVAHLVREIRDFSGKEQALAVYDTATVENPAHADICAIVELNKPNKRSIRSKLFELAKKVQTF